MPLHKVTDFLSEISAFFRKKDAHKAMYSILDVIKWLRMNESTLFGMKSKCNNVYPLLQVFQALLLYPCFMVRNPYRFTESSLSGLLGCKKDVFYRFMSNPKINWRKSVYHLTLQLWSKIRLRSGRKEGTVCLIVDDTDYPKTGRRMENIGRVFSHVHHRCILGFKALFLEAYRIYAQRWSLEVVFKEAKGLLGLGKCQAGNFASQIAATSLTALQYNILSLVKRFAAYETMGKLFEDVTKDSLELSVAERIWGVMQELVIAVAELFGLTDEDIYQAIINREEDMKHICDIYRLKPAS